MKTKSAKKQFPDSVRFNWGFHDGMDASAHRGHSVYTHFDKAYLAGWQAGFQQFKSTGLSLSSDSAWSGHKSLGVMQRITDSVMGAIAALTLSGAAYLIVRLAT